MRCRPGPVAFLLAGVLLLLLAGPAGADAAALRRAWSAWEAGDLPAALEASEAAVRGAPADPYAWKLRGWILSAAGRKAEAADAYGMAIRLDAADAVSWNNRGVALLDLGRLDEALEAFERALAIDGGYADARNNVGVVRERQGRLEEARRAYREAVDVDPRHARAHNNLGAVAIRQGRVEEGEALLRRAAELDPRLGVPDLNLILLRGRDVTDEALYRQLQDAAAQPGASVEVRSRALMARAGREARDRRFEVAHALYMEALALTPSDPSLLNNLAVVEDQLGLDREAMLHLEAALQLQPSLLVARNNIGIVLVHRGTLALAKDTFEAVTAEDPAFHRAHYNLGVVLASEGRLQEAVGHFETAARLAPRDADVRYNLAVMRRQLGGSVDDEVRGYEAALALDPDHAEANLSLGCLLADPQSPPRLRDEPRARRLLQRYLAVAPPHDEEGRAQADAWLAWLDVRAR